MGFSETEFSIVVWHCTGILKYVLPYYRLLLHVLYMLRDAVLDLVVDGWKIVL